MADWLPELAAVLGAKRPRRIPRWIGRLIAGEPAVAMMTDARGASNAKAKQELGWQPHYPELARGVRGRGDVTVAHDELLASSVEHAVESRPAACSPSRTAAG